MLERMWMAYVLHNPRYKVINIIIKLDDKELYKSTAHALLKFQRGPSEHAQMKANISQKQICLQFGTYNHYIHKNIYCRGYIQSCTVLLPCNLFAILRWHYNLHKSCIMIFWKHF